MALALPSLSICPPVVSQDALMSPIRTSRIEAVRTGAVQADVVCVCGCVCFRHDVRECECVWCVSVPTCAASNACVCLCLWKQKGESELRGPSIAAAPRPADSGYYHEQRAETSNRQRWDADSAKGQTRPRLSTVSFVASTGMHEPPIARDAFTVIKVGDIITYMLLLFWNRGEGTDLLLLVGTVLACTGACFC